MSNPIHQIDTSDSKCPAALRKDDIPSEFPIFWAIGNLDLLDINLLGIFCSIKCPGNIILKTYDFMRVLREAGVAVVSGFHSPIEKDCLDILLKGAQPIVVCPARSISRMRIPIVWRKPIDTGRLLVLSPFNEKQKRPTVFTAQRRNRIVALLARGAFLPYAAPGSRTENLCKDIIKAGKQIFTFKHEANQSLLAMGAKPIDVEDLNLFKI